MGFFNNGTDTIIKNYEAELESLNNDYDELEEKWHRLKLALNRIGMLTKNEIAYTSEFIENVHHIVNEALK